MRFNRKLADLAVLTLISFALGSCSQEKTESAVAKSVQFSVSDAIVLPTKLANSGSIIVTCTNGASGPRVRVRFSLRWDGMGDANNILVPLSLMMQIEADGRLAGEYRASIGSEGSFESVSPFFGEMSKDYLEPSAAPYISSTCFGDFGGLPNTKVELTGSNQVVVNATFTVLGVMRNLNDMSVEIPFLKEARAKVTYSAGSIPID